MKMQKGILYDLRYFRLCEMTSTVTSILKGLYSLSQRDATRIIDYFISGETNLLTPTLDHFIWKGICQTECNELNSLLIIEVRQITSLTPGRGI